MRNIHFPGEHDDLRLLNGFRSPAQFRLIFEEFFWLECGVALKRSKARDAARHRVRAERPRARRRSRRCCRSSPPARRSACSRRSRDDMAAPHPDEPPAAGRRRQRQDASWPPRPPSSPSRTATRWRCWRPRKSWPRSTTSTSSSCLSKLGYVVVLLTGSFTAREKTQLKKLLAEGLVHVVDRHARAARGGRRVQAAGPRHRRRAASLRRHAAAGAVARRASHPDVLVMTATPIPRTLALTIYGDLDVSRDRRDCRPGRKPIVTKHVHGRPHRAGLQLHEEADRRGPPGLRGLSR